MNILICGLILFFLSVSAFAFFLLIHILIIKTKQVTEFLAITDWFGRYSKISQRIRFNSFVVRKTRAAYKYKPIREMPKAFGQLFEEDFEKLFPKLQPGVTYRVVTHYNNIMEKAAAERKIVLIGKSKCDDRQKCQCKKGGNCKRISTKIFREYFFVIDDSNK